MKITKSVFSVVSVLGLSAGIVGCGEFGSNNEKQPGSEIVADMSELPPCTTDNEGEQIIVKNDSEIRYCSDGGWFTVVSGGMSCSAEKLADSSGIKIVCNGDSIGVVLNGLGEKGDKGDKGDAGELLCVSEKLADSSGVKIVCNGDSIGVVLNGLGEKGEKGDKGDDGAGCTIDSTAEYLSITCGDKTLNIPYGSIGGQDITLDSSNVAIYLDSIAGYTQKGPFLTGSRVLVKALSEGTLNQNGNSFDGKILNDNGRFSIPAKISMNNHVLMQVNGYYRNEVTGEHSNSELTLFGLVDLKNKHEANINLLTHLEYDRITHLVLNEKMKIDAAKKQAQQEIFNMLHINGKNFSSSEDLNVFGSSDEDGALLAASILFQRDFDEAHLTELLGKTAADLQTDGEWNDVAAKAAMAEWAYKADSAGRLAIFRNNVKKWGLGSMVANFEKYIRNFWYTEFGLGDCIPGEVAVATQGYLANTETRFICVDSTSIQSGWAWRLASDIEKDTYGWADTTDGAVKYGDINKNVAYVFDKDRWITADEIQKLIGGCIEVREGNVSKADKTYYICRDRNWVVATDQEKDTYQWADTTDGAIKKGDVNINIYYVYDKNGSYNGVVGWRPAIYIESLYGGCVESLYGQIRTDRKNGVYYVCSEKTHTWERTNDYLKIDTQSWTDKDDGYAKWGDSVTTNCYVYDTDPAVNGWRKASSDNCSLGLMGCTKSRYGMMLKADDGNFYNCANDKWSLVSDRIRINTMGKDCKDTNDGEMIYGTYNDAYFVCESNAWREASSYEEIACRVDGLCKACIGKLQGTFASEGGTEYVCDSREWRIANCAEINTRTLCSSINDSSVVVGCEETDNFKLDYVCTENKWHGVNNPYEYTLEEWEKRRNRYYTEENLPEAVFGEDLIDPRDGEIYKTVVINGMTWMAENLRYGDSIAMVNLKGQSRCYNDELKNCKIGGRYYTWTAAVNLDPKWLTIESKLLIEENRQGVCPSGWHLPSESEFEDIYGYRGEYLSAEGFTREENRRADDRYGFAALPTGRYLPPGFGYMNAGYNMLNQAGFFWMSSEAGPDQSYDVFFYGYQGSLSHSEKHIGYSVRCVKDRE